LWCFSGYSYFFHFKKIVIIQNILPFDLRALAGFKVSFMLKALMQRIALEYALATSFRVVSLTSHAEQILLSSCVSSSVIVKKSVVAGLGLDMPPAWVDQGVSRSRASETFLGPRAPLKVAYVSDFNPYKQHIKVIECVERWRDTAGSDLRLVLFGKFTSVASRQYTNKLYKMIGVREWIEVNSDASGGALIRMLRSCDFAVFASDCESFGQIAFDYEMAGIPFVTLSNSGFNEVCENMSWYCGHVSNQLDQPFEKILGLLNTAMQKEHNYQSFPTWGCFVENLTKLQSYDCE